MPKAFALQPPLSSAARLTRLDGRKGARADPLSSIGFSADLKRFRRHSQKPTSRISCNHAVTPAIAYCIPTRFCHTRQVADECPVLHVVVDSRPCAARHGN